MRAFVLEQPGDVTTGDRLVERAVRDPEPGPGEVRLRVAACGACHTDLHVAEGDLRPPALPLILGHQIVARVESRGPGATRFAVGDRVGVAWLRHTCGACEACRAGRENLCPSARFTGLHAHGGFAELAVAPEAYAYPLPGALPDVQVAPLLCAGIVGYRAYERSGVQPGQRLAIIGFGASAHLVCQVAVHHGCQVFAFTRSAAHQALARRLGAAWAGGLDDAPPALSHAGIFFPPVGTLVPRALELLAPGGVLALAGVALTDIPALQYERHLFHERELRSVTANTRADGAAFLKLAESIPVRAEVERFPLGSVNDVLRLIKAGRVQGSAVLTVG
jgi:propanol-preferring alcohol dehydrogenase